MPSGRPIIGHTRKGSAVYAIAGAAAPVMQGASAAQQRYDRQPQTTAPAPVGPYTAQSRESEQFGFLVTGQALGSVISQPLVPTPGHARWLDLRVTASGGVNGSVTVAAAADAPWSAISQVQFRDAGGSPLHTYSGYQLYLLNLYGAQTGFWNGADPAALPSFSAVSVGTAGTGNFAFRIKIPFELFGDAYCTIPMASQAAMPTLRSQLGASADLYTTAPGTLPTVALSIHEAYWAIPLDNPNMVPYGDGSTSQWFSAPAPTAIPSASNTAVTLPPLGFFLHTLILVFRDSTGARSDSILPGATSQIELWVDQVPEYSIELGVLTDRMFQLFGVTRPAGVLVVTYRNSIAMPTGPVSGIDDGTTYLPTNPGSILQLRSSAWGTFNNSPASVTALTGRLYAVGPTPSGHLANI
jgi:hypothetical protein